MSRSHRLHPGEHHQKPDHGETPSHRTGPCVSTRFFTPHQLDVTLLVFVCYVCYFVCSCSSLRIIKTENTVTQKTDTFYFGLVQKGNDRFTPFLRTRSSSCWGSVGPVHVKNERSSDQMCRICGFCWNREGDTSRYEQEAEKQTGSNKKRSRGPSTRRLSVQPGWICRGRSVPSVAEDHPWLGVSARCVVFHLSDTLWPSTSSLSVCVWGGVFVDLSHQVSSVRGKKRWLVKTVMVLSRIWWNTYGSFMRMNTLAMKKLRRTLTKPMKSSRKRLSLGMLGALERSRIIKPSPPMVKRKLEARPSMMYWPLTLEEENAYFPNGLIPSVGRWWHTHTHLYARKATGRWCPCSSVIDPTLGGSTMTS